MNRSSLAFSVIVGVALCLGGFSAIGGEPKDKKAAQKAFKSGSELFTAKEYREAATEFRRAMELAPSWKIHFNIGQCEAAAKRYGRAFEAFQLYMVEGGDALGAQRESEVQAELTKLKSKVGALQVRAPDGAQIWIDEELRATAPLSGNIYITAGKDHQIELKEGEEVVKEEVVKVWSGETAVVDGTTTGESVTGESATGEDIAPLEEPVEGSSEPVISPPKDSPRPLIVTGWVLTGIGGAALIAGGITGAITTANAKKLETDCPNQVCTDPNDQDRIDSARTTGTLSTVLLSAGGGIAAVGIVLLIVGKKKEKNETIGLNVVPTVTQKAMGITLSGRF